MADFLPTAASLGKSPSDWSLKNFPLIRIQLLHARGLFFFFFVFSWVTSSLWSSLWSYVHHDPVCFFSELVLTQSTLKVLANPNAATSSLLPYHIPFLPQLSGVCLEMPQMSVPKSPKSRKHKIVLFLSGSLEASSQLGLSKGDTQPLPEVRRTTQHSDNSPQRKPTSTLTSKYTKPFLQCPEGGWWVQASKTSSEVPCLQILQR